MSSTPHFVMFYGPWCEHCKNMMPAWEALGEQYSKEKRDLTIAKVDCTSDVNLCVKQNIRAYPTMKLYYDGDIKRYTGRRNAEDMKVFVDKIVLKPEGKSKDSEGLSTSEAGVHILTKNTFDKHIELGLHFVKFYAPWCIHCIKLAPIWERLAEDFKDNADITISKIDCTAHGSKCSQHGVNGFPTLKLFKNGREVDRYSGMRSLEDLKNYVKLKIAEHGLLSTVTTDKSETAEEVPPTDTDMDAADLIKPYQLNNQNFDTTVSLGTTFVKFYAPWCRHCKILAPVWDQLANKCADQVAGPKIAKVDCTKEESLCQSFGINGYPTLMLFKDGVQKKEYSGNRDLDSLYRFIMQNHDKDEL
ncbi:predicted protein [Nematostella vectensis]|uniref:Thioredoxin domain-containing protein n=1 Tax=Nematostella vectensis TaxID=45351 RepID=A7SNX3_NEMVE|nr:predicted protein [Nematostella vectensis]|eukprot:XP_001626690.1 predicted protein [Nematostella vectensis]